MDGSVPVPPLPRAGEGGVPEPIFRTGPRRLSVELSSERDTQRHPEPAKDLTFRSRVRQRETPRLSGRRWRLDSALILAFATGTHQPSRLENGVSLVVHAVADWFSLQASGALAKIPVRWLDDLQVFERRVRNLFNGSAK